MISPIDIAARLGLKKAGRDYHGACPSCGYKGAFAVHEANGAVLVKCHAGCRQDEVIDALRQRGAWHGETRRREEPAAKAANARVDAEKTSARARDLWGQTLAVPGTPVATYLAGRGIDAGLIPQTIRYLPDALHTPTGRRLPAMVAAVVREPCRTIVAVHRTYLRPDGTGKADVPCPKMTLGAVGGGAVRFAPAGEHLVVGEGIETCLSVFAATGLPTWSALSAGGIEGLILPPLLLAAVMTIAADNDANGRGYGAALKAATRWTADGRRVRIMMPSMVGDDFNDVLVAGRPGVAA